MKKLLIASLFMLSLYGCNNRELVEKDTNDYISKTIGLEDCKSFEIISQYRVLTVIRCPNSAVTSKYKNGKKIINVITVDGVEYSPVVKKN